MFINGQQPAWLPRYAMVRDKYSRYSTAVLPCRPSFLNERRTPEGGFDIWGVEYTTTCETGGAAMPSPYNFILDDICKWRDIVKAPNLSQIDWETMARRDLAGFDRENTALCGNFNLGYFQQLMAFLGFSEGLCAMYEEPEEVKALFQYLADFYAEVVKKYIEYYKPDIIELVDDTATALNPFISIDMYRELIKPYHYMQNKPAIEAGIPIVHHNCGRCEDFIDDWLEIGIIAWNPAQVMNDLDGIKKKYGRKLGLIGCWDSSGPASWDSATEDVVRQAVRNTIDRFAPGGGFCFWGGVYGPAGDTVTENKRRWLTEEYETYGRSFYNN